MITLQELCKYLDDYLNCSLFKDFSKNGLQIEGGPNIQKIAVAVTANLQTIEEAYQSNVDALIVHHGLFWEGDSYVIHGIKRNKIKMLLENDISLLAYHLPLDAHQEVGNNWKAAHELGWSNLEPFGFYKGIPLGVKGTIPKMDRIEFKAQLEKYYQHQAIHAFGGQQKIEKVGLISGGAYKQLGDAANEGLDAFITGSFDLPAWDIAHEQNINFYALGHTATEKIGPQALGLHLLEKFKVETIFIDVPNPF